VWAKAGLKRIKSNSCNGTKAQWQET